MAYSRAVGPVSSVAKPKTVTAAAKPEPAGSPKKTPKKASAGVHSQDGFDIHSLQSLLDVAPTKASVSVAGVAESLPVNKLSEIKGGGLTGDTFLLDGGSLRGMKLRVRRCVDTDGPGMDINFWVGGKSMDRLETALKNAKATAGPLEFRATKLGDDGLAHYTGGSSKVTEDDSYAPSDMSSNDDKWTLTASVPSGGKVELAHGAAAHSARGLVRITLRGDDAKCTKQLGDVLKRFGLSHLTAPPTKKSKDRYRLMRALWQAAHGAASKLAEGDLEKLTPTAVSKKLKAAGVSEARQKELRLADVADNHFTVVDPAQADMLKKAGARYLYSTVESIDHVAAILNNGQKSSVRRYLDGMIIDGMSTNEDFSSGGGAGVFTRVVTENAILDGGEWTGRRFKILLKPEVLGRTDWFGWPDDKFGQAWGLSSDKNFSTGLLDSIDNHGEYEDYNELIFRDAIGPQYIGGVVATNSSDRVEMIEALKKRGFVPMDGTSIEDFVICAPDFMHYGPAPYDLSDLGAFLDEAMADAKQGKTGALRWFLISGPASGPERAALEKKLIMSGNKKISDAFYEALGRTTRLSLSAEDMTPFLEKLQKSKKAADKSKLERLVRDAPLAVLATNSDTGAKLVAAHAKGHSQSWGPPMGQKLERWVATLEQLIDKQDGAKPSASLALAKKIAVPKLLEDNHKGFAALLRQHPMVAPEDPAKFVAAEVKKLAKKSASEDLLLFIAQAKSADELAPLQIALMKLGNERASDLLERTIDSHAKLGGDPAAMAKAFLSLPAASKARAYLAGAGCKALIRLRNMKVLAKLSAHWKANPHSQDLYESDWIELMKELETPEAVKWCLVEGGSSLIECRGAEAATLEKALKDTELFEVKGREAFIGAALKKLGSKKPGDSAIRLAWLSARSTKTERSKLIADVMRSGAEDAEELLDWLLRDFPEGTVPMSGGELRELVKSLSAKKNGDTMLSLLFERAGKSILLNADKAVLAILDKKVEEDGAWALGLSDTSWSGIVEELATAKSTAAKATSKWVIKQFGGNALTCEDGRGVPALRLAKASPKDIGLKDDDAVLDAIQSIVEDLTSELEDFDNGYYDDEDEKPNISDGLPESVRWLLEDGDGKLDDGRVKKLLTRIPDWADEISYDMDPFFKRLSGLGAKWKKPVAAAKKKFEANQ